MFSQEIESKNATNVLDSKLNTIDFRYNNFNFKFVYMKAYFLI